MSFSSFGFTALWSPAFFITLVVICVLYFLAMTKYRMKISRDSEPLAKKEIMGMIFFFVLLYILKGSPIDLLGHIMFSMHMTQMAFLYLVLPPILVTSVPNWLWRKLLSKRFIQRPFHFFTKPLIALFVFNGAFSFYHIPLIFDAVKTDMVLHGLYTAMLFVTAVWMWWPIMNKLEEYQTFYGIKRIGYIFANGILLTPACGLIIFGSSPFYETYTNPVFWLQAMELCVPAGTLSNLNITGPEMFNTMPLLEDQRTGGVIMKIIQEIVFGVILAKLFFSWYKDENSGSVDMNPTKEYQVAD